MYTLLLTLAIGQQAPPIELTYAESKALAEKTKKTLVIFVGVKYKAQYADAITTNLPSVPGRPEKCILISNYNVTEIFKELPVNTTAEIVEAVIRDSRPRKQSSPWLPDANIKSMWPEGVPYPENLKFYQLPKASQRIAVTNDRRSRGFHSISRRDGIIGNDNINREFPYIGSGGLDFDKDCRNITGLAIPDRQKIKVWTQLTPILAGTGYQNEEMMFWQFPEGTQAYDVLVKKNEDGSEHVFTVRIRTRLKDGWDEGKSFFPDVPLAEAKEYKVKAPFRLRNLLNINTVTYRVHEIEPLTERKYRFREQRTAINDGGHFTPANFVGTGVTCSQCHVKSMMKEDSPYGGPALRGQDSVFSWYPITVASVDRDFYTPELDHRWPLDVR